MTPQTHVLNPRGEGGHIVVRPKLVHELASALHRRGRVSGQDAQTFGGSGSTMLAAAVLGGMA